MLQISPLPLFSLLHYPGLPNRSDSFLPEATFSKVLDHRAMDPALVLVSCTCDILLPRCWCDQLVNSVFPLGFRIIFHRSPISLVSFCICNCIGNAVWAPIPPRHLLLRLCLSLLRSRIHGIDSPTLPNNIHVRLHVCILCMLSFCMAVACTRWHNCIRFSMVLPGSAAAALSSFSTAASAAISPFSFDGPFASVLSRGAESLRDGHDNMFNQ